MSATDARRRGVPVIGDLELASWFLQGRDHRHHRIERQDHDHGADRSHPQGERHSGAGGRQHRHAAGGHGGDVARRAVERAGAFQFPTRNHLDTFRAHIGAALNVTPDHLDRHYTFEKLRRRQGAPVREPATPDDFAVLNADDPVTRELRGTRRRPSRCGSARRSEVCARSVARRRCEIVLERPAADDSCRSSLARRAQSGKHHGCGDHGAAGGRDARADPRGGDDVSRASSIASNSCASWTASPGTTIRKPPTWTRRSKPSRRSRAGCG